MRTTIITSLPDHQNSFLFQLTFEMKLFLLIKWKMAIYLRKKRRLRKTTDLVTGFFFFLTLSWNCPWIFEQRGKTFQWRKRTALSIWNEEAHDHKKHGKHPMHGPIASIRTLMKWSCSTIVFKEFNKGPSFSVNIDHVYNFLLLFYVISTISP